MPSKSGSERIRVWGEAPKAAAVPRVKLTTRRRFEVVRFIKRHPRSTQEIAEYLGVTNKQAAAVLTHLCRANRIEKVTTGYRKAVWR